MALNITVETLHRFFSYYSFESMLSLCASNERSSMPQGDMSVGDGKKFPFPWELATFAMLACAQRRYGNVRMQPNEFKEIINYIRKNWLQPSSDYDEAIKKVSFQIVPEESEYQENGIIRFLRYHWIFSFEKDIFSFPAMISERFGITAHELLHTIFVVLVLRSSDCSLMHFLSELQKRGGGRFSGSIIKVLSVVSKKHDKFAREQIELIKEHGNDWRQVRNLLWTFPVIRKGKKLYTPLSFLVENALTVRLLSRITFGHAGLRSDFGKEVLEAYLVELFKKASCYKSVSGEREYSIGKGKIIKTPDIIVRNDEGILLIDSKASEPSFALRDLSQEKIVGGTQMYGGHVVQMFNRIKEFSDGLVDGQAHDRSEMFGIVSVYRDGYFDRQKVFEVAFHKLGVSETEQRYIRTHITILDIRELEKFCYLGENIFPALKAKAASDNGYQSVALDNGTLVAKPLVGWAQDVICRYRETVADFLVR